MQQMIITIDDVIRNFSLAIMFAIIIAVIIYTKKKKKAWSNLKEGIFRVLLPLGAWIAMFILTSYNLNTLYILISVLFSFLLYILILETEHFLSIECGLAHAGRVYLFFYEYLKRPDVREVDLYYHDKLTANMNEIFKMIYNEFIENKEDKNFLAKLKDLETKFSKAKIHYYFYFDYNELMRGLKCLIVASEQEDPLINGKLEGAVIYGKKREMFGRDMQIIVLFEGTPKLELLEKLEMNIEILINVFGTATDVRLIPVLREQINQANNRTELIEKAFKGEIADNIMIKEMLGKQVGDKEMKMATLIKYIVIVVAIFGAIISAPTIVFIILSILGVI